MDSQGNRVCSFPASPRMALSGAAFSPSLSITNQALALGLGHVDPARPIQAVWLERCASAPPSCLSLRPGLAWFLFHEVLESPGPTAPLDLCLPHRRRGSKDMSEDSGWARRRRARVPCLTAPQAGCRTCQSLVSPCINGTTVVLHTPGVESEALDKCPTPRGCSLQAGSVGQSGTMNPHWSPPLVPASVHGRPL